jgi:hypothetical protein
MLPLLSLHTLVAHRGDGLHPELLALLTHLTRCDAGLSATIQVEDGSADECPRMSKAEDTLQRKSIPKPQASE